MKSLDQKPWSVSRSQTQNPDANANADADAAGYTKQGDGFNYVNVDDCAHWSGGSHNIGRRFNKRYMTAPPQ
jgi:hypothetical protein